MQLLRTIARLNAIGGSGLSIARRFGETLLSAYSIDLYIPFVSSIVFLFLHAFIPGCIEGRVSTSFDDSSDWI